jgi:hypothetical protein
LEERHKGLNRKELASSLRAPRPTFSFSLEVSSSLEDKSLEASTALTWSASRYTISMTRSRLLENKMAAVKFRAPGASPTTSSYNASVVKI